MGGNDASIFAANAGGKTRLVSAFSWLLFNKDALGRSAFEIKNLDAQGEAAHGLEHSVEADLDVNGQIVNLKKVYQEKWQKKRGSANKDFTGHTTNFYIDGVPTQEKDYVSRISEIAGDESRFRLLTSPTTFPALHWKNQRALLLDICGDITDQDVMLSNEKLSGLTAILGKHTLDDHRRVVAARRSEINKAMEQLPVRIDEVRRGIPDVTGIDRKKAEQEAQHFETALNDAKLRLQGINTGGSIATLTTTLSGLNADLRKMEDAHRSGSLSTLNRLNQQISELEAKVTASRRRVEVINGELKWKDGQVQGMDADLSGLREKWALVDADAFKDTTIDTCAACGQALPSDRVQEAREKAMSAFNQGKADRLGDIQQKGKTLREQKDRLETDRKALKDELGGLVLRLPNEESELKRLTEDRDALKRNSEDFAGVHGRSDLLAQIAEAEAEIRTERDGKSQDIEAINGEIRGLQTALSTAKGNVNLFTRREQGEKRIEELKVDEKKLAAEFEKLEGEIYWMEQFIKTKVALLTDRINGKFETVRFKLFNQLVNGGIEDCCEITVGGIGFNSGLNNAARINAGLEIVKVLQQHDQIKAPVFADNAEAVNNLVDVGCQMIRLYVSEDKQLRIEVATKERLAA